MNFGHLVVGSERSDRRRLRRQRRSVADGIDVAGLVQKIADLPTQRNRVHADFSTGNLDGETDRLVALGAKVVEKIELPQVRYTKMTDPVDNRFDLVQEFELPKQ